jgi:HEAT repeats
VSAPAPLPTARKRRWRWLLAVIVILAALTWIVLNHLLPLWAPMLVLQKVPLPGASVRAVAVLMEQRQDQIGVIFGPPTGELQFDSPWMRRTDAAGNEHYILPVQWSFRSFLRSGSLWEKRAVLGAASTRGCGECFHELVALLQHEEPDYQAKIANALGLIATDEALMELEKLCTAPQPEVRMGALLGLRNTGDYPQLRGRTLALIRKCHSEDPSEEVRAEAASMLMYRLVYGAPVRPAVPFDAEILQLFRSSTDEVRKDIAEALTAAAFHRALEPAWLPEVAQAWHDDSEPHVKANAALVLAMENHALAGDALTYLETRCPPGLRPLSEAKLRAALMEHLPHGLKFQCLERDWKRR